MLPNSHPSSELEAFRPRVEKFIHDGLVTAKVQRDDLMLIGVFIHAYTYIELNLHRAVRLFRQAGSLSSREAKRSAAGDLTALVLKGSAILNLEATEQDELEVHLREILLRQPFRNLLAHWGVSRLPNTDVLVFVTMDERDAKMAGDQTPHFNGLYYAMALGADLRGLAVHIQKYESWLALRVAEWQHRLFPEASCDGSVA
jgi:hypothetical protein